MGKMDTELTGEKLSILEYQSTLNDKPIIELPKTRFIFVLVGLILAVFLVCIH